MVYQIDVFPGSEFCVWSYLYTKTLNKSKNLNPFPKNLGFSSPDIIAYHIVTSKYLLARVLLGPL